MPFDLAPSPSQGEGRGEGFLPHGARLRLRATLRLLWAGDMLDAIVVGAGPAGLYSSLLLAEEGFDVALLEEHAAPGTPTHCTGVISDELSDLFKIPESLILNRPTVCTVVSPSGRALRFTSNGEGIAVIDRGQFDGELGLAAQRAGVEIKTGFRTDHVWPEPG